MSESRGTVSEVSVQPTDKAVSHETLFTIHKPVAHVYRVFCRLPQEAVLKASPGVTGVAGSRMMRGATFESPGSRRLLTLTDENTIVEEVLEEEPGKYFSYKVWHSSIPSNRFLEYATNQFWFVDQRSATMIRWRRAFKLRRGHFPGLMGGLGRLYFKWTYVDGTYARFMDQTALAIKRYIESAPQH